MGGPEVSRMQLLLLLLPLLCASATEKQLWQEGEILSRKTVIAGHRNPRTAYVYRIKAGGREYLARFDQPLAIGPYAPVKFSVTRKNLFVQNEDGSELKAELLQKTETTLHR